MQIDLAVEQAWNFNKEGDGKMLRLTMGLAFACAADIVWAQTAELRDGWTADGVSVTVPHTWNAEDAADGLDVPDDWATAWYSAGSPSYLRKTVVYRRALPDPKPGKRYFVSCGGASINAKVSVNGVEVGRHVGSFTGFCFELTEALKSSGNVLEFAVDNVFDPDVQPIHADFSVYGGLYRVPVLHEKDRICIDPRRNLVVSADPKTGHVRVLVPVAGGEDVTQEFDFPQPALWSPESPSLYPVTVRVGTDEKTVNVGFRTVEFREDGFYLNGKKRKLRGVCRHQDREGKGWGVSAADEAEDVRWIKRMGADAVRTSHYPQSETFYDLCDREGLLVWTEVPNVNALRFTHEAEENERMMAREMVEQHRNHPCIFAWGLFNELYNKKMTEAPEPRMSALRKYVEKLDPTRPTVAASCQPRRTELNAVPGQIGFNLYPGWYGRTAEKMDEAIEEAFRLNPAWKICAVSEYGCSGCVTQHADAKFREKITATSFHPEEYQAYLHWGNYRGIAADPRVWGSFLWVMFDLGSDARREGARFGVNDKGMVTWDRTTAKDAYFFYKANWNPEPILHLVGTRMTSLTNAAATVMAFSNAGSVELRVNGVTVGTKEPDAVRTAMWDGVPLRDGVNEIEVRAGDLVRTARWRRITGAVRERLSDGWQFMRADGSASETNSAAWKAVRVPHDWGVDKPFDPKRPYGDAYLEPTGIGWYRRTFRVNARQKELLGSGGHLLFESNGAMSHSKVWINGRYVGGWPYGYTPFTCDLTPYVRTDGENELVIRCHNKVDSSRWYTGGGLYRECRFAWCPKDHLVPGSVAITTPRVAKDVATVKVAWTMSESGPKERTFSVVKPRLWDVDDPYLYSVDVEGERFRYGIRTIGFHSDERGFQLNGRRVQLNGVSLHHDLGVLGAAFNRAAMKRRFLKLKEAGVNAIRCSHNEEDPGFLDLCDELGLLVKDEAFDEWRHIGNAGKRKDGYSKLFDEWHERDVRAWVRADRNHPSVIMWSLGNEICDGHPQIAPTAEFIATARELDRCVKLEDRTRPTTNANNCPANTTNEYGQVLDIYGFNYFGYTYRRFREKNPNKPFFGSETACTIASRGEYVFPVTWGWTQEKSGLPYSTGYGTEGCGWDGDPSHGWAVPPDVQWHWMDENPTCMGEFVWTGWDYLGGPAWADKMVAKFGIKGIHSCATGFIDLAGFPKDTFWLYQSRWRPDLRMAHIVPHWNWPDRVGKVTPVHVFTSGDEGELFLNGRSLGRRKKVPGDFRRAYRLTWDDVVYEPGTVKVVTYKGGKPWAEASVSTTGPAAKLTLEPEATTVKSDSEDLVYVNLSVRDAEGRVVPRSRVPVEFSLEGPGEIVATDNGDETDFTSFHSTSRTAFNGHLQAILRAKPGATGTLRLRARSVGLQGAELEIAVLPE